MLFAQMVSASKSDLRCAEHQTLNPASNGYSLSVKLTFYNNYLLAYSVYWFTAQVMVNFDCNFKVKRVNIFSTWSSSWLSVQRGHLYDSLDLIKPKCSINANFGKAQLAREVGFIKNIPKLTPLKSIRKKQTSAGFVQIQFVILFAHVPVFFCVIHPNAMLGSKLTEDGFRFFNWGFLTNQYQRSTILYNYIRGNSG